MEQLLVGSFFVCFWYVRILCYYMKPHMSACWMGTWVHGYGFYHPIPIPTLPNGYNIFPFVYPWVIFYPIPVLLLGFYPPGTRVMGTHCHPYFRRRLRGSVPPAGASLDSFPSRAERVTRVLPRGETATADPPRLRADGLSP
jgi:hypothetical protein